MSAKPQIARHCKDCPEWTHTVCCHMFGKFWRDKSSDGTGCRYPVDDVATAWRKAGWLPGGPSTADIALPWKERPQKPAPKATYRQQTLCLKPAKQSEPSPLSDDDY